MQTNVGEILSGTISMVISRIGGLAGLWLAFFAFQIVLSGIVFGAMGTGVLTAGTAGDPDFATSMGGGFIVLMLLFYAAYLYFYGAQSVAMGLMASPLVGMRFGDALVGGFKGGLGMLGAMVLLFIALLLCSLAFGLVAGIMSFLGSLGVLISTIAVIGLMVYFAARLVILPIVIGVDGVSNPVKAIMRSWQMTGGSVLHIILALVLLALFAIVLFLVPVVAFFGTLTGLEESGPEQVAAAMTGMIGMFALFGIVSIVLSVVSSAMFAVIHAKVSDTQTAALEETFG